MIANVLLIFRVLRYVETNQERQQNMIDEFDNREVLKENDSRVPPKRISLHFLWPVLKAWLVGMALSIGAFVAEVAYHYCYQGADVTA